MRCRFRTICLRDMRLAPAILRSLRRRARGGFTILPRSLQLDPKSLEYFQKVLPAVRDTGYEKLRRAFELTRVRTAALHRLSDEGLSDVEVTNALINALRYPGR